MSYQLHPSQLSPSQQESGYDTYANTNTYTTDYGHDYSQHVYSPTQQQFQPDMRHPQSPQSQPPSPIPAPLATPMYHDGFARVQTWVANQPPPMSPPSVAKTPFSEWTGPSDGTFDRRTMTVYSPSMPPRPPQEEPRVCGIKRTSFFIVLAISMFLLVVAVAVGLGVGLGTRKSVGVTNSGTTANSNVGSDSSSSSSGSPTSTTPTSTTSATPTTTKVSPTPSFTGALIPGPVFCPQDNNTVYVSTDTSKPFNIQCGRDYSSAGGATDIKHMEELTMAGCIDACSKRDDCVGVGWGRYQGTYQCWMKSHLGKPNWSSSWYFAQLQDMPTT